MKTFLENKSEMCLFSPFVLMSVFVVLCWKWRQICRSPTNQFEKNLFQIGSNLKKAYFKLVRIWKKPFSNWFVEMEFVSQIFRHNGLRTNRPYLSAEKSGRKIWGFPGTKIFPQKMFPQLVPSLSSDTLPPGKYHRSAWSCDIACTHVGLFWHMCLFWHIVI